MRTHLRLLFCLSLTLFLNSVFVVAAQTASPAAQPTPPPNAPVVPPVTSPNQPAPGMSGVPASQPNNTGRTVETPIDQSRIDQAGKPIPRTPAPAPKPTPPTDPLTYVLDWSTGSETPDTIYKSGSSNLRLKSVNDILFSYQVSITEIKTSTDDLSQVSTIVQELVKAFTPPNGLAPNVAPGCALSSKIGDAKAALSKISDGLDKLQPKPDSSGKCPTIALGTTLTQWDDLRSQYDKLESLVPPIQEQTKNQSCQSDPQLKVAVDFIDDDFPDLQQKVIALQRKRDTPHIQDVPFNFKRTSDYDITVTEICNGVATSHAAVDFHLNRGFDVLTLSGGFLMTKLQARSYSVVAEPTPPPPSTPARYATWHPECSRC